MFKSQRLRSHQKIEKDARAKYRRRERLRKLREMDSPISQAKQPQGYFNYRRQHALTPY